MELYALASAWVSAHPMLTLALLYLAFSILNGLLKGEPKAIVAIVLDRLVFLSRSDAVGTLTLPIIGKSVFEAVRDRNASSGPKREGFARLEVVCFIGGILGVLAFLVSVTGCPMPAPDGCTPMATRCSPQGIPQTCSATQRWSAGATAEPCSAHGANVRCCWTRSPYGRDLHACVPESACLPEPPPRVTPPPAPPAAPIASAAPFGAWREWLGVNSASKGGAQ